MERKLLEKELECKIIPPTTESSEKKIKELELRIIPPTAESSEQTIVQAMSQAILEYLHLTRLKIKIKTWKTWHCKGNER